MYQENCDMNRKWAAFAVTLFSGALFVGTVAIANDEDSPLHKLMEKVQAKNTVITKGIRNKVNYTKAQKDVKDAADELVKLAKEAKPLNDVAKKANDVAKWDSLMDDYIKEAEDYVKLLAKPDTDQPKAKDGYKAVSKTCTACHDVFRKEE
jgi:cytochrome c556